MSKGSRGRHELTFNGEKFHERFLVVMLDCSLLEICFYFLNLNVVRFFEFRKILSTGYGTVADRRSFPKHCGSLPEKHKRRKLLKPATFSWHSGVNSYEKKMKDEQSSRGKTGTRPECRSITLWASQRPVQGCGEQFRKGVNVKASESLNMDDTTPDELAAYVDQVLHLPKPMSQMAEMMYT